MLRAFAEECGPEATARVWNKVLIESAREAAQAATPSARKRLLNNDTRARGALRTAIPEMWGSFEIVDGGCLKAKAALSSKVADPPKPTAPKLTPMEQSLLLAAVKAGGFTSDAVNTVSLDANDADLLRKAAEESEQEARHDADFTRSMCRKADEMLAEYSKLVGDALWSKPIIVETVTGPDNKVRRIIFVRSATAPLFRTHGPIVKHDFRANGKPVNINHESAYPQLDGLKLIRSSVHVKKTHEYYVKGLKYQDGMYFKGYFVVDGQEMEHLARYYQVRGNMVFAITQQEYQDLVNRVAGGYDKT
jgi:hypothetical protein